MALIAPADPEGKMGKKTETDHNRVGESTSEADYKQLDAGALFVLKSKGSWLHCGYHLTTSIVAPALLSLPLAISMMGWTGGLIFLFIAALVTFYSYALLSLVLEHHAQQGNRLLRFRDLAHHVLGDSLDRRTTTGYCAFLGPNLISWTVKKQTTVARSSTKAEYRALSTAATDIIWLQRLLKEFAIVFDTPNALHCDNMSTLALVRNPVFHARTKHIEHHLLQGYF